MKLSNIIDAVIGLMSVLWFVIRYTFTRTRCCVCGDKILRGELKYRITEKMGPDTMCTHVTQQYCTRCMHKVPKSSATEIVCLNEYE